MYIPNNILIQRLKKQPKISQGPQFGNIANQFQQNTQAGQTFEATIKNLNNEIFDLKQGFGGLAQVLENVGNRFNALTAIGDDLQAGLGVVTAFTKKLDSSLLDFVKTISYVEIRNKKLNETFKVNSETANIAAQQMRQFSKDLGIGDEKLFKFAGSLKGMTGGFILSNDVLKEHGKQLLQTQTYIQNNLGLSEESAQKFELYARGMGQTGTAAVESLNAMTEAMASKTGMDATQLQAQIIEDITNMGADLQAQYGRVPGQLEKATMKARLLGTTLEQLNSTGQNMLNIESSIGTELEYQQLTGRRLLDNQGKSLTNEYRMATLKGDATKQADLMQQFLEQEGDTLENNMLARKQAAQLFGMSEADLMRQKQQADLVNELGIQELMKKAEGEADAIAEAMKAEGFSADKISEVLKASDTRTMDQRMVDSLESLESFFIGQQAVAIDGPQGPLTRLVEDNVLKVSEDYRSSLKNSTMSLGNLIKTQKAYNTALKPVINIMDSINDSSLGLTAKGKDLIQKTEILKLPSDALTVPADDGKATGGFITGPGTGTSDSIPARLSDGEYVINAAATRKYRPLLDKINKNPAKMAAGGGPIMSTGRMETLLAAILTAIKSNNFDYGTKKL